MKSTQTAKPWVQNGTNIVTVSVAACGSRAATDTKTVTFVRTMAKTSRHQDAKNSNTRFLAWSLSLYAVRRLFCGEMTRFLAGVRNNRTRHVAMPCVLDAFQTAP